MDGPLALRTEATDVFSRKPPCQSPAEMINARTDPLIAAVAMKIGIYVQTWHVGGVAAFSERLAVGLNDLRHSPCLVLSTPYGKRDPAGRCSYDTLLRSGGCPIVCLHLNVFHPKERAWRAADAIAALELDVLFLSAHGPLAEAWARLCPGTPLIGIAHNDDEDTYAEFKATEAFCDAYVAVSTAILSKLEGLAQSAPQTRRVHIPYGVPIQPVVSEGPCSAEARVLAVCRLDQRQKRVLDLPVIWSQYRRGGGKATLSICGTGPEERRLEQAFADEVESGGVKILGAIPLDRMPEIYAQHDLLISVSAYEGLPLSVLEAATHGLWLLLSNTRSGHPEIVETLSAGCLCGVGDVGAFAAALRQATDDLQHIRGLRRGIQTTARTRFGLERMVGDYADLGQHVLARRVAQGSPLPTRQSPVTRPRADFVRRFIRKWQYSRHYGWRDYD